MGPGFDSRRTQLSFVFFATTFDFKRVEEEGEFWVYFCPFWKLTNVEKKTLVFLPFLELG
jgi:hypothetical protein